MSVNELIEKSELEGQLDELQPGTTLLHGQYTITRFLNNGGFGITYLAKDSLDRDVVIKECFADAFCRRTNTIVSARSRAHQGELKSIIRHFIQEARSLSKLKHPNIVGVHQVFEDNDTAYMAIDFIDGRDLLEIVDEEKIRLAPEQIVDITRKLLSAIGYVHEHGLLHRDISPDNILLNKNGDPILIDFGAARENEGVTGRKHSALRVVKDGYSPQEFYIAGSDQGPWSDLYALAASLYHAIKGEAPVNGQARLAALAEQRPDPYDPLAGNVEGYPAGFLEAIDKAMITKPSSRLQSSAEWLAILDGKLVVDGDPEEAVSRLLIETKEREGKGTAPEEVEEVSLTGTVDRFAPLSEKPALITTEVKEPRARGMLMAVSGLALLAVLGVAGYAITGRVALVPDEQPVGLAAAALTPTSDAVATEAAAAEQAAAEAAAAEQAAAEAAAMPDLSKPLVEQQVSFALWDVAVPFEFSQNTVRNAEVALITSVSPDADLTVSGDWIADGTEIYTINDRPLSKELPFLTQVLNALVLDPDGYTRATVRYKNPVNQRFERGLMAVPVVRRIGLANGTLVEVRMIDGAWSATVLDANPAVEDGLLAGDILVSETTTGQKLVTAEALDAVMAELVKADAATATFEVMRDGSPTSVEVFLARQK